MYSIYRRKNKYLHIWFSSASIGDLATKCEYMNNASLEMFFIYNKKKHV